MKAPDFVEAALRASSADGAVVIVNEHSETNLRWAGNSLTTNGQMHSRSVTVLSTYAQQGGTSVGVVTRAVTDAGELTDLVRASEAAGRAGAPADDAMPLVENYAHTDPWDAPAAETSVEVFGDFAPALGAAFTKWQSADRLLFGFAEHQLTSTFLGSSTGLRRRFDQPNGRIEINGKSRDYGSSAYVSAHTQTFADVDATALTDSLLQRLDWARTRIDLPAGRYETLMPPSTVADLMIYAYWNAAARDAEEGRSVFGERPVGSTLSPLPLHLYSDPSYAGLQCAPFEIATESGATTSVFDNGSAITTTDWIRDGKLADLIRTRSWAQKTDAVPRLSVGNLVLESDGAAATLEEMVSGTERGLLLTCLWYIREVDPQTLLLTGLTRDGVYLVEDGAIKGAVNNFRFNESPVDLLGRVSEIGRTELTLSREWADYFTRTAMPALRVPDFNMSTVSAAN
ncbi:MAG TPA: metallopeptidase TldD-related protein [Jatrophihabitans sp.]|jgi:predicted Zn-dependent protease